MRKGVSKLLGLVFVSSTYLVGINAAPCPEVGFGPPANFPIGLQNSGLAAGDLNGDGKVDLVAANEGSGTLTVRFGNGAGAFPTSVQFSTVTPSAVAVADFNRDGILDIVTTNRNLSALNVRLGMGGGAFRPPVQTMVGPSPAGVATGDFNGDGNIDIVASNAGGTTFSLLLGNAIGSFPVATQIGINGSGSWGIVVADFNGDGNRDVATANRGSSNMNVLLGNGSGSFAAPSSYSSGNQAASIETGDFNGDGRPDLAVANAAANTITVRLNNGAGLFPTFVTLATGLEPFSVATGDLDNDGKTDLVETNRRSNNVSVFRGNGNGTFAARTDFALSSGPRSLVAADLNGNGMLDLATGVDSSSLAVMLNSCSPNSAPTIVAGIIVRKQDAGLSNSSIATVGDGEDNPANLMVTINGGASATVNGVTVSNMHVGAGGNVTADAAAACGASDAMFTLAVTDSGGLSGTAVLGVDVTDETTPPVINKGRGIPGITVYLPVASPDVSMPVEFNLPMATDNCTDKPMVTSSPESGSIFNIGTTTVTVTAVDELENTATATFRVNVLFNFGGLLPPIDPFPETNTASGGSSVPVKFSLSGFKGMDIFTSGYPASSPVPCDATEPGPVLEPTQTAGGSVLSYDDKTDVYTYVWKTSKAWRGSCRILVVKLADGGESFAMFSFR